MATSTPVHPLAVEHLPSFITPPGQTDILFNFVVVFMIAAIFTVGVLYMRLHALPEHLAHGTQKVQYEIVAVLGLIALFTHNNIFWIAALILALIDLPDFLSPLRSMASSLRRLSGPRNAVADPQNIQPVVVEPTAPPMPEVANEPEQAARAEPEPSADKSGGQYLDKKMTIQEGAN